MTGIFPREFYSHNEGFAVQPNAFNVVVDGQWGSCGKGLIATALASHFRPDVISTTNMPNAGHTAVWVDGQKFVAKALPSAAALCRWMENYRPRLYVGAGAVFDPEQLKKECDFCGVGAEQVMIHERAMVLRPEHAEQERSATLHIASTMQGCGAAVCEKLMRGPNVKLAKDYAPLHDFLTEQHIARLYAEEAHVVPMQKKSMASTLNRAMSEFGAITMLHEGAQGFSLDINHGSHYPYCTSRQTTALQSAADMGIAHQNMGDVYLVIRPYPIRVGNVYDENGETLGHSGGAYENQAEITWAEVAARCGAPAHVMSGELTTVTKRLRRVFEFSIHQLQEAATINGATQIALNFANYIDWSCFGCREFRRLPRSVHDFIAFVEDATNLRVSVIGTGPQNDHVILRDYQ